MTPIVSWIKVLVQQSQLRGGRTTKVVNVGRTSSTAVCCSHQNSLIGLLLINCAYLVSPFTKSPNFRAAVSYVQACQANCQRCKSIVELPRLFPAGGGVQQMSHRVSCEEDMPSSCLARTLVCTQSSM